MTRTLPLSRHAQQRRKQMRVTEAQIDEVLEDPDLVYPGLGRYPGGRTCFQRGPLVVVADSDKVVTVLWHGKEGR